jgi:acyl-CoA thioester hydrolase
MTTPTPPDGGYRYHTAIAIRYGDMDTLGHVNNAKYLTYLEQARVGYFRDLPLWSGGIASHGLILAKVVIDYRAPLTLDDITAEVWTRVSRLGGKSFDLEQRVLCQRAGATVLAAESTSVVVAYDYLTGQSVTIPDEWRARITAFEPALSA